MAGPENSFKSDDYIKSSQTAEQHNDHDSAWSREFSLVASIPEAFAQRAVEAKDNWKQTAAEFGTSAAISSMLSLALRSGGGWGTAAKVTMTGLGALFVGDVVNRTSNAVSAGVDAWNSPNNLNKDKEIVGTNIGAGLFDLGVMSAGGVAGFGGARLGSSAFERLTSLGPKPVEMSLDLAANGALAQHEPLDVIGAFRKNASSSPQELATDKLFAKFEPYQKAINLSRPGATYTSFEEAGQGFQEQKLATHSATKGDYDAMISEMNQVAKLRPEIEQQVTASGSAKKIDPALTAKLSEHLTNLTDIRQRIDSGAMQIEANYAPPAIETTARTSESKVNSKPKAKKGTTESADAPIAAQTDAQSAALETPERTAAVKPLVTEKALASTRRQAESALDGAATNRGRETNAFKSLHDYLQNLLHADESSANKEQAYSTVLSKLMRIRDWDKPTWFKSDMGTAGSRQPVSEHEFIRTRNGVTEDQMKPWDDWATEATKPFKVSTGSIEEKIAALDDYMVRRVSVDSVKNWLRRRPEQPFINDMFGAMAENKLYIGDNNLRVRALADNEGQVRPVELRDGKLMFEGTDDAAPIHQDERGKYVVLPNDSDMIVFERRTVNGARQIVPMAQPNDNAPNIQWFGGDKVKIGWAREQRFWQGPQAHSQSDLYGFFPEHFPMRITNSAEFGKPTEKTGAAIYGYARDHAGRQSRQLIADYGTVMDGLKRNNSQLISDARAIFGVRKPTAEITPPGGTDSRGSLEIPNNVYSSVFRPNG